MNQQVRISYSEVAEPSDGNGPNPSDRSVDPIRRLTKSRVEALRARGEIYEVGDPACPGLQIRVALNGTKSWHWRFSWNGKRVRLTLGTYPAMNLAEAHQQSEVARALTECPWRSGLYLSRTTH